MSALTYYANVYTNENINDVVITDVLKKLGFYDIRKTLKGYQVRATESQQCFDLLAMQDKLENVTEIDICAIF